MFNVCVFFIVYFVVDHWEVSIKVTIVFVFLLVPSSPPFLLRGRQGGQVAGKDQQVFQEDPVCPCSSPRVSWQNFVGCVTVWWTDSVCWRGEATLMWWWHMENAWISKRILALITEIRTVLFYCIIRFAWNSMEFDRIQWCEMCLLSCKPNQDQSTTNNSFPYPHSYGQLKPKSYIISLRTP